MYRSGWLVGLCVLQVSFMTGCGSIPGLSSGSPIGSQAGFSLIVSAPDGYQGNSAVTMRFNLPNHSPYKVAALSSDIERIDVMLMEMGTIAVPSGIPLPTPASAPSEKPPRPNGAPKAMPAKILPAPASEPLPSDMEQWPTILPGEPTPGKTVEAPPPAITDPPPPRLEKPLVQPSPVVAKASIGRSELAKGQGDVVFNRLKAGVYGIQLVAFDREGRPIGKSMQSVTVLDGQTATVNTQLVLNGPEQGGNVAVGVTIVETGPGGSAGGSAGSGVATASPPMIVDPMPLRI